jgi:hypothetical protein
MFFFPIHLFQVIFIILFFFLESDMAAKQFPRLLTYIALFIPSLFYASSFFAVGFIMKIAESYFAAFQHLSYYIRPIRFTSIFFLVMSFSS